LSVEEIRSPEQAAFPPGARRRFADCRVAVVQNRKAWLWTFVVLGALGLGAGAAVVFGGLYNIAATAQHLQPVYTVLDKAMRSSVQLRARDIAVPPLLEASENVLRGAACYRDRCAQCHGGPGVAADAIGLAMQPLPGSLIGAARGWQARELYWITRNGIKMSGMPAWQHHLSETQLWAVVAFVQRLPTFTPGGYGELMQQAGPCRADELPAAPGPVGERAARGRLALRMYGCHGCHAIPGITGSQPQVGPPLAGFAGQRLIAGRLAHTHDNLVAWIRHPQRIDARTAMPDLGVTPAHADEMAAYLATLH
jgi:mono/diheme cytochrome c family protein